MITTVIPVIFDKITQVFAIDQGRPLHKTHDFRGNLTMQIKTHDSSRQVQISYTLGT